jgi:hypothetical protein
MNTFNGALQHTMNLGITSHLEYPITQQPRTPPPHFLFHMPMHNLTTASYDDVYAILQRVYQKYIVGM